MQLLGVKPDLVTVYSILRTYFQSGMVDEATSVFRELEERDEFCWTSIIVGYSQSGRKVNALVLFNDMMAENSRPDNYTISVVVSVCAKLSTLGEILDAWSVFGVIRVRNVVTWNAMITGHSGLVESGWRYFISISESHGMKPILDYYACMINLFDHSGHMEKAVYLIKEIHDKPNHFIWSTILNVSKLNSDIERPEMAVNHLPRNAVGPYIMLSNMYASLGRWNYVASIQSPMKERNVVKFAAYSCIKIDQVVQKFVSDGQTHPQADKIYKELDRLIIEIKKKNGFIHDLQFALHDVRKEEKFESICHHSEKLALAFGLIRNLRSRTPIRIINNIRVCGDCNVFMNFVSKVIDRTIILRDLNFFHHFFNGQCSCMDFW
ncbi:hypothetical protein GIB67_024362 [Kingdonia uniflora]|uniref:DYW domain-containing protein n=1 Tax=Kingdonia uniflora TaxID=39325 RepID=A0A7J7LFD7_9MAGN|nr:hypothetical protein GIB67_024362 [Kingdonia uniflora]